VIGFSQGACLASETVLRNPRPYGFIGVLSAAAPSARRERRAIIRARLPERAFSWAVRTMTRISR
jgi:predicted esterase